MQQKKVVLGAGIAGLGVYHADPSAEIYEASDGAGGLCSGFSVGDFYFDRAVHLSFSKDPLGRFGRWEYLWSDQAFLSGYHAGIEGKG